MIVTQKIDHQKKFEYNLKVLKIILLSLAIDTLSCFIQRLKLHTLTVDKFQPFIDFVRQVGGAVLGDRGDAGELGGAGGEEQGEGEEDEDAGGEAEDAEAGTGGEGQEGHGKEQGEQQTEGKCLQLLFLLGTLLNKFKIESCK